MRTELNQFERDFATAAVAIDTLYGGNYRDDTGEYHLIVDAYSSGMEEPAIGPEDLTNRFLEEGVAITDQDAIRRFIDFNQIENRLHRLREYEQVGDKWRSEFLTRLIDVLEFQLDLRKSLAGLREGVPEEKAYSLACGRDPEYIDSTQARENLIRRLESVGLPLRRSTTLTELVDQWTQRELLNADQMEEQWGSMSEEMNRLTEERVFPFLPEWVAEIPPDSIDFGIMRKKVHYSGLNLAKHTVVNGKPVYSTIIRMADSVTKSGVDYKLNLVAHEGMPGHGLHLPISHGLYVRGDYGFETTLLILCSPFATLAEGLAKSTTNLLYGSNAEDSLTPDESVALARVDMDAYGRNNVVVKYIRGERDHEKLAQFLREEYCFSEDDAVKYSGWLFHPKMGKILGLMYLPSYGVGRHVVKTGIEEFGREIVIPVVYGTKGQVDIVSFPERLKAYHAEIQ